jgi:hypothetical protein
MLLRALPNAGFVEVTMEEATTRAMRVALIFGKRPIWAGGPYDAFVA